MTLKNLLKTSWQALLANKSRSLLTMLGIIIGIASVIIILSVGASAQGLVLQQIKSIGSNLIVIFPGKSEDNGPPVAVLGIVETTLKNSDLEAIKNPQRVFNVQATSGYVRGVESIVHQENDLLGTFLGVSDEYLQVEDAEIDQGRFFTSEENKSLRRVVVLGSQIKEDLFGDDNPLGKKIKIKKESFEVIGVLAPRGSSGFQNPDNYVFLPINTAQKILLGIDYLSFARVKIKDPELLSQTVEDIRNTLREEHGLSDSQVDDFTIRTMEQGLDVLTTVTNALKFFLAAIAAISLVVGGVGIMNIMFVAISERTREIGLRKAIGAKNGQIIIQFLFEAMFLAFIGGLFGILSGILFSFLISVVVNYLGYDWEFIITFYSILLSVCFSVLVGFVFGLYPAYKASKLNPIQALRYE